MFKKFIYFLVLFSMILNSSFSCAEEKITAEKINTLLYDHFLKEGSYDDLNVNVTPYPRNPYIKSTSFNANNIYYDGFNIDSVSAKTLNSVLYLKKKGSKIVTTRPVDVSASVTLTENNINNALKNKISQYLRNLKVKLDEGNYMYINFLNPSIEIKGSRIYLSAIFSINGFPDFFQIPVTAETGMSIINKKIVLDNLTISGINVQSLAEALKKQHISVYDLREFETKNKITIKNANIDLNNDKIKLDGIFTIPANSYKFSLKVK